MIKHWTPDLSPEAFEDFRTRQVLETESVPEDDSETFSKEDRQKERRSNEEDKLCQPESRG